MARSMERGQESENKDPVISALENKLQDLRDFGGKTGEAAIPRLESYLEKINKGDKDAYDEIAKEFGLMDGVTEGEIKLDSKGKSPKEISTEERDRIEKAFDREI